MDDGDWALEGLGSIESIILFENIHKGMLPFCNILHPQSVNSQI